MCFQFVFASARVPNAPLVCIIKPVLPEYRSVKLACVHPAASKQQLLSKQQMEGDWDSRQTDLSNKAGH